MLPKITFHELQLVTCLPTIICIALQPPDEISYFFHQETTPYLASLDAPASEMFANELTFLFLTTYPIVFKLARVTLDT